MQLLLLSCAGIMFGAPLAIAHAIKDEPAAAFIALALFLASVVGALTAIVGELVDDWRE